jgi:cytochrome c oxidase assembly factor 1
VRGIANGTASFTSVRRGKEGRFEVLRWRITRDDGVILDLAGSDPRLVRGDGS